MNAPPDSVFADLVDPALALQVDKVCDQFEREIKQGKPALIEVYLPLVPPGASALLFAELLHLEISYGASAPAHYHKRFPNYRTVIDEVFRNRPATAETGLSAAILAEGRALALLDHPGLVRVYDVDLCEDRSSN